MSRFRLGLRSRVTWAFAIGGLALTLLMATLTLTVTSSVLLNGRDSVAQAVVFANASRVQQQLTGELDPGAVQGVVDSLNTTAGSRPLLITDDGAFALDESAFGESDIPADLQAITIGGQAGRIRVDVRDSPVIVHGIPLQDFEGVVYYEAVPLAEVEDTLSTLQLVLLGGGLIVRRCAALTGRFAAGRALSPLRVSAARPKRLRAVRSTPVSIHTATKTSSCSPRRSTRWPAASKNASNETRDSRRR